MEDKLFLDIWGNWIKCNFDDNDGLPSFGMKFNRDTFV